MRKFPLLLVRIALLSGLAGLHAVAQDRPLTNREVLVVFNKADPESVKLAEVYREARDIPPSQVLGFDMPVSADMTRADFEQKILTPLRDHFQDHAWWRRQRDSKGVLLPVENRIRAMVLMRGVPLRIQPTPASTAAAAQAPPTDPISPRDEASVDSELALFGVENLPTKGILKNAFYDSNTTLAESNRPFMVLTTRIDSPTYATCKRMIDDAVETEKNGLWGRAYVDVANKFPQGDLWLNKLAAQTNSLGIPTLVDRFNDTLPKNYPMTDAALYYGWYDWNVSGPFLNPSFLFRKGAVAVHLHSFSADQLRDPHKNWCAPLLVRGAAATLGNVYEPYLHLTHHFDIFHDRLLKGWSFAEASWASIPVASWQGVALGDPLYRPFLHLDGTGEKRPEDRDFRIIRAATREWPGREERAKKLEQAVEQLKSGNIAEGLALDYLESGDVANAQTWLRKARELYTPQKDKLRQDMQLAAIERSRNNQRIAINELRAARAKYGPIPEADALAGWLDILDPPPPPLADPGKNPN